MSVIISEKHRKVLVPEDRVGELSFPRAPVIDHQGTKYRVIDHGTRETIILRRLGVPAPAPILTQYDWPGDKTPFQVQKATCELETTEPRAYVLNDMGTGKTKTPLWSWDFLRKQGLAGKMLIVAPLSTLWFTWSKEIMATLPGCKFRVLHGTAAKRLAWLEEEDVDVFVINHEGVKVIAEALAKHPEIDTLVIDELAKYRNNGIGTRLIQTLAKKFKWVHGMTGRPMPNGPLDVYNQCRILTPHTVPKYYRQAQAMLMDKVGQFKWEPKPGAVEVALSWMTPAVRYTLDDVVELPECVHRTIDVPMSDEQAHAYKKVKTELAVQLQGKQITAVNAGVAMGKLLQIAGGWVYTPEKDVVSLDVKARVDMLIELVEEAARKVIIFAPYRHHIAGLSKHLDAAGIEHAVVHGDVKDREEIFGFFQNTDKYRVLLAHPQCMAHGVTLTAADTIIWYLPTASLEIYEQANARIRRVGQKHKQQILHLQGTQVEKRLYSLLAKKQKIQDLFLRLLEEATDE